MCFLTALLLQITLVPFQTIDLEKGASPYKILIANDSLLYYQDDENELEPIVGYNYKSNSYFGNLKFGKGPLEIIPENRPIALFADDLFYLTDRAQNKVVVYDKLLNPTDEYISQDESLSMSYLSGDIETSVSLSPTKPLIYSAKNRIQTAPKITDPYLEDVSLGSMMRQYKFRTVGSSLYLLPIRTDYVLKYDSNSNELSSVRLNMLSDLPDPRKHVYEAPGGPFGGMDVTFRK